MSEFSEGIVGLLKFLMPGFVVAWILYGLTDHKKPSQFNQIIQALLFTVFVQLLYVTLKKLLVDETQLYSDYHWNTFAGQWYTVIIAVVVGIAFSALINNDWPHKLMRKGFLTKKPSFPSEWYAAFNSKVTFVVLHLKDERRLYGWPQVWPAQPDSGHFILDDPSWLVDDEEQPINGVGSILVDVCDVKWVEFIENKHRNGVLNDE